MKHLKIYLPVLLVVLFSCKKQESVNDDTNKKPVIEILNFYNNQEILGSDTFNIMVDASDEDGFITKIEYFIDEELIKSDKKPPFLCEWYPGEIEGQHVIQAIAWDNKDKQSDPAQASIKILNSLKPSVEWITVPTNPLYEGDTLYMVLSATDYDGTIAKVEFSVNSSIYHTDTSSPYQLVIPSLETGQLEIVAEAFDDRGQSKKTTPVIYTIGEDTPPQISWDMHLNYSEYFTGMSEWIRLDCHDVQGEVVKVEIFINGEFIGEAERDYSDNWSLYADSLYSGNLVLTAIAYDEKGLKGHSGEYELHVEKRIEIPGLITRIVASNDPDKVYCLNNTSQTLMEVDPFNREITSSFTCPENHPVDMAYSAIDNKLYIISQYSGTVDVFNPENGSFHSFTYNNAADGIGIDLDSENRRIYIASTKGTYIIDMDTEQIVNHSPDVSAQFIKLDTKRNQLFIFDYIHLRRYSVNNDSMALKQDLYSGTANGFEINPDQSKLLPFNVSSASNYYFRALDPTDLENILGVYEIKYPNYGVFGNNNKRLYATTSVIGNNYLHVFHEDEYDFIAKYLFPNSEDYVRMEINFTDQVVVGYSYDDDYNSDRYLYFFDVLD